MNTSVLDSRSGEELINELADILPMAKFNAENGDAEIQLSLGQLYAEGTVVEHDADEAKKWLLMAAEQGHVDAYYLIGVMCFKMGNSGEAIEWFTKAAEQDYTKAHMQLSFMSMYGHGVEKDEYEAFKWSMRAAELGDRDAMYEVAGRLSWFSDDPNEMYDAVTWYKKAALKGHLASQYELALIYSDEEGVIPHDYVLSYTYASAAVNNGHKEAVVLKSDLAEKMTPEQQSIGDKLAAKLKALISSCD